MKHFSEKLRSWKFINKWWEFGTCEGVYFLVKLKSEVDIQIFQSKFYRLLEQILFSNIFHSLCFDFLLSNLHIQNTNAQVVTDILLLFQIYVILKHFLELLVAGSSLIDFKTFFKKFS